VTVHPMPSEAAIDGAADVLVEAELALREGTVEEAARRAYTPTGPSLADLVERIQAIRDADRAHARRAS
jgi:hypothetical protein